MSAPAMDIVLPVAGKDCLRLRTVGASLRKFWEIPGRLIIAAPDQDQTMVNEAAHEHLDGLNFLVVPDSLVLKRRPSWNARKVQGNWWQQQLVKLCAAEIVDTDFYLILDADCFCTRPIRHSDLVVGGRARVTMESTDMFHPAWYRASMQVLGIPATEAPTEFVNVTPFIMAREPARTLMERLAAAHGQNWKGSLLLMPQAGDERGRFTWTEYTLYYLHARNTGAWSTWHHEQREPLTGNAVWFIDQVAAWDPRKSFEPAPTPWYFSLVQSHVSVPIERVWEQVKPFLSA